MARVIHRDSIQGQILMHGNVVNHGNKLKPKEVQMSTLIDSEMVWVVLETIEAQGILGLTKSF
jgi:hypothetical protein